MATFWKDVLAPGVLHVPTGDGKTKRYRFDDADVQNADRLMKAKLADGWNVPVTFEHQSTGAPVKLSRDDLLADSARNCAGWIEDSRVNPKTKRLEFLHNIPNAADVERAKAIRYVSPLVEWNFTDSTGSMWPGLTVQHVALTPRPVQNRQSPIAIALSLPANAAATTVPEHCSTAKGPIKLSLEPTSMDITAVMALLRDKGINLPEDTVPENFFDRLGVALMQTAPGLPAAAAVDDVDADDDEPEDAEDPNKPKTKPDEQPIAMSLAAAKAERDTIWRGNLANRVKRAVKLGLNPGIGKELETRVGKVALSYNAADGTLAPNEVTIELAAYEKFIKAGPNPARPAGVKLSKNVREADHLYEKGSANEMTAEEVKAALDAQGIK